MLHWVVGVFWRPASRLLMLSRVTNSDVDCHVLNILIRVLRAVSRLQAWRWWTGQTAEETLSDVPVDTCCDASVRPDNVTRDPLMLHWVRLTGVSVRAVSQIKEDDLGAPSTVQRCYCTIMHGSRNTLMPVHIQLNRPLNCVDYIVMTI